MTPAYGFVTQRWLRGAVEDHTGILPDIMGFNPPREGCHEGCEAEATEDDYSWASEGYCATPIAQYPSSPVS